MRDRQSPLSGKEPYDCRECQRALTAAEAARYVAQERDFEAFERSLSAADPALDEEAAAEVLASVPASPPASPTALTMVDGQVVVPAIWGQPRCDTCEMTWLLDEVREWPSPDTIDRLVWLYETGTHDCSTYEAVPQSLVMALSWSYVLRDLYRLYAEDDPTDEATAYAAGENHARVAAYEAQLSPEARQVAAVLAANPLDMPLKPPGGF